MNLSQTSNFYKEQVPFMIIELDLSEIKQQFDELHKLQITDLLQVFDENPSFVFDLKRKVIIVRVNKQFSDFFHLNTENLSEQIQKLAFPKSTVIFKRLLQALYNGEYIINSKIKFNVSSTEIVFFKLIASVDESDQQTWNHVWLTLFDISEFVLERKAWHQSDYLIHRAQQLINFGYWERDLQTDIIKWSETAYAIFGIPQTETIHYQKLLTYVHPDDIHLFEQFEGREYYPDQTFDMEYRIVRPDGEIRTLLTRGEAWFNHNNQVIKLVGIVRDITTQQQAAHALKEKDARYRAIVETAHDAILLIDCETNLIVEANKYTELFFGRPLHLIIASNYNQYFPDYIETAYKSIIENLKIAGSTFSGEILIMRQDGELVPTMLSAANAVIHDRRFIISIHHDISHRKKRELELQKMSAIVEQSPLSIVITKPDGSIEYVNPKFTELTGYTPDEVIDKNPRILQAPNQPKEKFAEMWKNITLDKTWTGELQNKKKNGDLFWEKATISSIKTTAGVVTGYLAIKEDITEDKQREAELITTNRRLKVLTLCRDAILHAEVETALVQEICSIAKQILDYQLIWVGYQTSDAQNINLIAIEGADRNQVENLINHCTANKTGGCPSHQNLVADSRNFRCCTDTTNPKCVLYKNEFGFQSTIAIPLLVDNVTIGVFSAYSFNIFDVNECVFIESVVDDLAFGISSIRNRLERQKAEKELIAAKEEAERANYTKSVFIANMSHEFRTPLNVMLGFSEILRNKLSQEPLYVEYIDSIMKSGYNLMQLLNDILDLSKIEAGKLELKTKITNLRQIINDIKQIFSVKAAEKNLEFNINIATELPELVLFDEVRFRQVLFNLVGNAVKFTLKGNITITIEKVERNNSKVSFAVVVTDSGIGIAIDQQQRIFEPFTQQHGQNLSKYEGTGLGLAITKRLIELMNAKILVTSDIGIGSTFTLYFSEVEVVEPIIEDLNNSVRAINFERAKILIADDMESSRMVIKSCLANYNFEIIEAADGREALQQVKRYTPDLAIIDLIMPEIDGYSVAERMKKNEKYHKIPIIALTVTEKTETKSQLFDEYLLKPVTLFKLITTIAKYLPHNYLAVSKESTIKEKNISKQTSLDDIIETEIPYELKIKLLHFESEIEIIEDSMAMDEIEETALKIKAEAIQFGQQKLLVFSNDLFTAANTFDIKKVLQLLVSFRKMLNQLSRE